MEGEGFMEPEEGMGGAFLTYSLIILNLLVFLYSFFFTSDFTAFIKQYGLRPISLINDLDPVGLVTYMFLHGDMTHLIANSFTLWGIGTIVERDLGSLRFGLIYIVSGIIAGLGHMMFHLNSKTPLVGASGAIFGVFAVLFLMMPLSITFVMFIPLPSVVVGLLMLGVEVSAFLYSGDSFVAHNAHLVGFMFGGLSSFLIDWRRALKGTLIAIIVAIGLYISGIYFNLF
jgi:membrane associated rhomboid family serine protease